MKIIGLDVHIDPSNCSSKLKEKKNKDVRALHPSLIDTFHSFSLFTKLPAGPRRAQAIESINHSISRFSWLVLAHTKMERQPHAGQKQNLGRVRSPAQCKSLHASSVTLRRILGGSSEVPSR